MRSRESTDDMGGHMKRALILATIPVVLACASEEKKAEQRVENEQNMQIGVSSPKQAANVGRLAIERSEKLTPAQKEKFIAILNKTQTETLAIKEQEGQLKSALFQDLASAKYDDQMVRVYKSKLQDLEKKKLDLMFSSLDQVRDLLHAEKVDHDEVMRLFRNQYF
ncbi:MAG: hypothetical protein C5B49_01805 [Bdellovibrio sp.]|nr:MAG: hypothetical protein C5B49_01805 [Bdellovibrio sp.]